MKTKSTKQTKQGISLIVLVITIIVMIILAAAVILSLSSNGIIDRANEAVEKTDKAQVQTLANTIWAEQYLKYKAGDITKDEIKSEVIKGLVENNIDITKYIVKVNENGVDLKDDGKLNLTGAIPMGGVYYTGVTSKEYTLDFEYEAKYHGGYDVVEQDSTGMNSPIRFGLPYSFTMDSSIASIIFLKEGYSYIFIDGAFADFDEVTYDKNSVYRANTTDVYATVLADGEQIDLNGITLVLDSDLEKFKGDNFPETVNEGDVFVYGDYEYRYNLVAGVDEWLTLDVATQSFTSVDFGESLKAGWGVLALDPNQERYGEILESINRVEVTNMLNTFMNSTMLVDASNIVIPNTVTCMYGAFQNCSVLEIPPDLSQAINLTNLSFAFWECTNLKSTPILSNCTKLTHMYDTFRLCKSLTKAYAVPSSVKNMHSAFQECEKLAVSIVIHATPTEYGYCFYGTPITEILGDCQNKEELLATK